MKGLLAEQGRGGQHFPGTSSGCELCWERPADPDSSVLHPRLPTRGGDPFPSPNAHWCPPRTQRRGDGGVPSSCVVSIFGGLGSSGAQRHTEGSALISLNNLSLNWGSEGLRAGESSSTLQARVCGGDSSSPEPVGVKVCSNSPQKPFGLEALLGYYWGEL